MTSWPRRLFAVGALAALPFAPDAVWAGTGPAPGSSGLGDPYFPTYGNGGYDVRSYDLAVRYDPATDHLSGVARIEARATQDLSRFNLDLVGLTVRSIAVERRPATWVRDPHELVVTPGRPVRAGTPFTTEIRYDGVPVNLGSPSLGPNGFFHTDDGAIIAGEPESAASWYPVNDHPLDKASYTFRVTVPDGYEVVANGLPGPTRSRSGWTTHVWHARSPMASYLTTVDIGQWDVRARETADGLPIIDAVDPDLGGIADASLARQEEVLNVLQGAFGPYPFETAGAIVDDHPELFFALETQTRPVYSRYFFEGGGGDFVVVHELAHQWFGDDVALARWQDIWLNEGFASYAEWIWAEYEGFATPQEIFEATYDAIPANDPFWDLTIGDPGPDRLFDGAVYTRGAMTLQALRTTVGDAAFFDILRTWAATKSGGNGTTPEFVVLAEALSGQQLDALFDAWLFTSEKPALAVQAVGPALSGETRSWADSWRRGLTDRLAKGAR